MLFESPNLSLCPAASAALLPMPVYMSTTQALLLAGHRPFPCHLHPTWLLVLQNLLHSCSCLCWELCIVLSTYEEDGGGDTLHVFRNLARHIQERHSDSNHLLQ